MTKDLSQDVDDDDNDNVSLGRIDDDQIMPTSRAKPTNSCSFLRPALSFSIFSLANF